MLLRMTQCLMDWLLLTPGEPSGCERERGATRHKSPGDPVAWSSHCCLQTLLFSLRITPRETPGSRMAVTLPHVDDGDALDLEIPRIHQAGCAGFI